MKQSDTEGKSTSGAVDSSAASTRLSGSWLIVARAVWVVLVIPSLGLFLFSLPSYYQQLQRACGDATTCNYLAGALPAQALQALTSRGFSVREYALLLTIFFVIIAVIWCAVGLFIFWRRSDDWLALLAAFFLVMQNITPSGSTPTYALAFAYPVLALPLSLVGFHWNCLPLGVLSGLPQWAACPALDGTDLAACHHQCNLQQLSFHHIIFRYKLASVTLSARYRSRLCRHHRFTNLPLQTRVHSCPTPTDEVDCLRSNSGSRILHRDFRHIRTFPIPPYPQFFRCSDWQYCV